MSEQDQNVSENSIAIQAQGDVSLGLTPAQMTEIMSQLMANTSRFTVVAMNEVDRRMEEFREEILAQFADTSKANPEAFRDPDFQYTLSDVQEAYARSGDPAVRETLADIIGRRSLAKGASRLALTLNDAAARAPKLTKGDFATLSLCYILRYTKFPISNIVDFGDFLRSKIMPFVSDIPTSRGSYWHIEAQSCGRISSVAEATLRGILLSSYTGVLGMGITLQQAKDTLQEANQVLIEKTLQPCLRNKALLQPGALSLDVYLKLQKDSGIPDSELTNVWNAFANTVPADAGLIAMLKTDVPNISDLFDKWNDTPLKTLELNSVGIAIGHANAFRVVQFSALLEIWVD